MFKYGLAREGYEAMCYMVLDPMPDFSERIRLSVAG
jgi:hypothetical protein